MNQRYTEEQILRAVSSAEARGYERGKAEAHAAATVQLERLRVQWETILNKMEAEAQVRGYEKGVREAMVHVANHYCAACCCDAQPSSDEAKTLAECIGRKLLPITQNTTKVCTACEGCGSYCADEAPFERPCENCCGTGKASAP